ncbi:hypothetical protein CYMTET_10330 [Cymbomonas tetramitiformis]|uniref:DUF1977 domain-containing protein n=1 Tax=Cymbomonas tetramitiformis TaxID=36881 RepID=A0AAE0GPY5_9CHLO|nr:hypothetical protein CYMTET_10330 [Cymbomonas tetramitiformis]
MCAAFFAAFFQLPLARRSETYSADHSLDIMRMPPATAITGSGDPAKRQSYDRYGTEDVQDQGVRRRSAASGRHEEEIDPFEMFNMFFGGMPMGAGFQNARVYRTDGARRQQSAPQAHHHPETNVRSLIQLLPLLCLAFFTFWPNTVDYAYNLKKTDAFSVEQRTNNMKVPFYVRSGKEFREQYPVGTDRRIRLEHRVEYEYRENLEANCYYERVQQKKLYRYGEKARAQRMKLPHCEELQQW